MIKSAFGPTLEEEPIKKKQAKFRKRWVKRGSQEKASLTLHSPIKSLPCQFVNPLQVPSADNAIVRCSAGSLCVPRTHFSFLHLHHQHYPLPPLTPPLPVPLLMPQGGVQGGSKHVPRAGVSTPRAAGSPMAQQSCRRGLSAFGLTTHQTFSHKSA